MFYSLHLERFYLQFQLQTSPVHGCDPPWFVAQVLVSQFQHGWTWCWVLTCLNVHNPAYFETKWPRSATNEPIANAQLYIVHKVWPPLRDGFYSLCWSLLVSLLGAVSLKELSLKQRTQKCVFFFPTFWYSTSDGPSWPCRWGRPCAILGLANQGMWILIPTAVVAARVEAQPHLIKKTSAVHMRWAEQQKSATAIQQDQINNEYKDKGLDPQVLPYMFSRALTAVLEAHKSLNLQAIGRVANRKPLCQCPLKMHLVMGNSGKLSWKYCISQSLMHDLAPPPVLPFDDASLLY